MLVLATACNLNKQTDAPASKMPTTEDIVKTRKTINKFDGIQFASKKDSTCGMPITLGIEDTLLLEGKNYGFCSVDFKVEFITLLKTKHKR